MTSVEMREKFAFLLAHVTRQWRYLLDLRFKTLGQTQARAVSLLEIARLGEVTQAELANALGVEAPTVLRFVDWLEKAGLVQRRKSVKDRRVHVLRVTSKAQPLLKNLYKITSEARREFLYDVSESELRAAIAVLTQVADRLDKVKNEPSE